ncbi:MAG: hypothetical protein JSW00_16050 [Thermoplasmata archaeon]|nr:MAG: hypothetical protein JSW00_16050 [Thermoplasmata archaeon]
MIEDGSDKGSKRYVDHPAPSVFIFSILLISFLACIFGAALAIYVAHALPVWIAFSFVGIMIMAAGICGFFLWPMYTTYYTIEPDGIGVRYGPWKKTYYWVEFERAYLNLGIFSARIGWPSVTPCVRMTDAVVFKRKKGWGLYLTPNDPREFLKRVSIFARDLTREAIF